MQKREWALPSGLKVRTDFGAVEVQFPKSDKWLVLTPTLEDSEDLLSALTLDIQRARKTLGKT